jgi:large subunit ribosomal protein L25
MTHTIEATKREAGSAAALRAAGQIPGVLYGPETKPVVLAVPAHTFEILSRDAGGSSLIDVVIAGAEPVKALIQDVQYDPVTGRVVHVDFRQINMKKEMETGVVLQFAFESPAVKELGGTLIKTIDEVQIRCLPKDLVSQLEVDLRVLKTFDDAIRVKDLAVPSGITILNDPEMTVAKVAAPLTEDQLKAMEEEGPKSLEDIEVEEKGKKEEDATAEEGAEPAKE